MERLIITPRVNWQTRVESLGLSYHTDNGEIYWDERVCYRFSADEIHELEHTTNEIEKMCLTLVDHVIQNGRFREFTIPEHAWPLITESWQRGDKALYGRFDFSYHSNQPPKLLEYNADTPTAILE
ncbi:MAG: glutathionylspermidine synthase family protein, partial [Pseudomonadota bacterium]|nr:glutathionylspermidine synthase family protein [Pseudomonadota bacterium]